MKSGYLGIEVSDKHVRYVFVKRAGMGHQVHKAGTLAVRVDAAIPGTLIKVIRDILQKEAIAPVRIFLTLSRRDTVIYQTVLPKMSNKELNQVVTGEIEKIPQFRNRPFEYIFHSFPFMKDKRKVIFAALDKAAVEFYIKEVGEAKSRFRDLEIAPLNLVSLISKKRKAQSNEALLVISDQVSYFIIFRDHQFKLFYTTAIGQKDLLQFGTSLIDARIVGNLSAELKRVLKSYLLDHKTEKVEQLYLVWDQDYVPDLDKHLAAHLEGKVESLDISRVSHLSLGEDEQFLNPAYVLAATPMICFFNRLSLKFPLDHLFSSFQRKKYWIKASFFTFIYAMVVSIILGGIGFDYFQRKNRVKVRVRELQQEYRALKKENAPLFEEYAEYAAVRESLLKQAAYVRMLNQVAWSQVMAVVSEEMPDEMGLTSFHFGESGKAKFVGQAFKMEPIAELIRRVDSSTILSNGKFDYLKEKVVEEKKIFDFGILGSLKRASEMELPARALQEQEVSKEEK